MAGLVEELQREALDPTIAVTALLRKVKLVAVKLQLAEAVDWVDAELSGYPEKVPDYRVVNGHLKSLNPYHGWRTVGGEAEMMKMLSQRGLNEPMASLEAMLARNASDRGNGTTLLINIPQELNNAICDANGGGYEPIALHFGVNQIAGIVDTVRNLVFDWALELEKAGITGEGISFSMAEKQKASASNISIGAVHGNLHAGDFTGGNQRNYSSSTDNSSNTINEPALFTSLRSAISDGIEDAKMRDELTSIVTEMEKSKDAPEYIRLYQKLIQSAGDHMKILGPFIGPLSALLAS